ncbi:hypothetical protein [Chlamydia suis]|uniref:hypothetical protein n=1 Tax=Chlamydia suis TaxID=83559 RepID=UPI00119828BF|nr:hypothetical protein [Chlamydia suis]
MKSGLLGGQCEPSVSGDSGDGRGLGLVGGEDIKRWYSPSREGPKVKGMREVPKVKERGSFTGEGTGVCGWGFGTC